MSRLQAAKGHLSWAGDPSPHRCALGFAPTTVILWWSPGDGDGCRAGNRGGIGFVASGGQRGAVTWVSDDAAPLARTASWVGGLAIAGLQRAVDDGPSLRAEVELEQQGFVIHWLASGGAWELHYLALGGSGVQARVGWTTAPPTSGRQRLALGTRPDLLLLASLAVPALGTRARGVSLSFGAASGPAAQAGMAFVSPDGAPPGSAGGAQRTDAVVVAAESRERIDSLAVLRGFDEQGAVLDWLTAPLPTRQLLWLAVSGMRCAVGATGSPLRPGRSRHRGIGGRPAALVCFTWGLGAASRARDIARLSIGAASSPTELGAVSWDDRDTSGEVTATHVRSSSRDLVLVPDTQTGDLHAAATLEALNRGGFTLHWSRSDGQSRQVVHVLLGTAGWRPRSFRRQMQRFPGGRR